MTEKRVDAVGKGQSAHVDARQPPAETVTPKADEPAISQKDIHPSLGNGGKEIPNETGEENGLVEVPFTINIELPQDNSNSSKMVQLSVSPMELVQELHQRLMDMQDTCHRTCFQLTFDGNTLDNFVELKTIENLKEGSTIKLVEEPYTQRKARIHVRHVRDLAQSLSQAEAYSGQDLGSPSFLSVLTGGDVFASLRGVDPNKSVQHDRDVDCTPPAHVIPPTSPAQNANGQQTTIREPPLAALLLETEEQTKKLQALKTFTLSGWNPPPGPRKLRGDLLYLYVTTLEDKNFHITSSTKGFFVNYSTENSFDPKRQGQLGKGSQIYHSLVDLLNCLSPGFKKNFAQIQKIRCARNDLERVLTPYQVHSWLAPALDHSLDAIRAEDASAFKLGYEEQIPGQTRDWNDELQSTKELPRQGLAQRVLRERAVFKVYADFVAAATRGAVAVVEGNVLALNPGEEFRSQMFIWNNIFFSLGFDVRDHYARVGGDAAAHVALANDLKGVQAYFDADVDGLHTLGTVVVDYRGYRVMAQSIIPGILEKEQDQSVVYGSIDSGKTVVSHPKYEELLGAAASTIKVQPHEVLNTEGDAVSLASSIECKGIVGDDGRHYILDLMRTFPPDVNYLQQDFVELPKELREMGFPKQQRHKLASLRNELIEQFVEQKYMLFVKNVAMQYHNLDKENNDANTEENRKVTGDKDKRKDNADKVKKAEAIGTREDEQTSEEEAAQKQDIVRRAAQAVNSLKEDEFWIRFNADAFLDHISMAQSETLTKERALIVEAAEFLVNTQIPALIREAVEHGTFILDGTTLTGALHSKGINVRYLGLFAKCVAAEERLSYLYRICMQEMICRSAKHIFVGYMQSVEGQFIAQAVAHFLNCLLSAKLAPNFVPACTVVGSSGGGRGSKGKHKRGRGTQSPTSTAQSGLTGSAGGSNAIDWLTVTPKTLFALIKGEMKDYFDFDDESNSFDTLYSHYDVSRIALMRAFCMRVGIQVLQKNYQLSTGLSNGAICEDDIVNLFPIVKHMEPRATDAFRFYLTAQSKIQQGYLKDGFELIAESLQLMNQVYGPMHHEIVQCLRLLARLSYIMGDHEAALGQQQRAVIMSERVNGFDSPQTIQEYGSLALYAFACGQVPTTLMVLYRMRYLMLVVCGEKHPEMATLDANIGLVLYALRQHEFALSFLESSLRLHLTFYGNKSMKTALAYHLVARTQSCLGDFRGALKNERETYAIYRTILGDAHERTKESSECLRHLTQQAVVLQKQINELSDNANMPKNANKVLPPIYVTPPPMANVLELLNIINGFIFVQISPAEIEALRAELAKKTTQENGTSNHTTTEVQNATAGPTIQTAHKSAGSDKAQPKIQKVV
ncbi:clustered mitochondria protein homolog isoform X1 [Varroa jacobsoni]|uniref:clustered mitochondria protein homolog isoform X1 n=1 Tax=Varroa jacobsoni TaxID=62625 RepID=UPI000BF8C0FA|nr:clustered mitochondria protein homolog isoform X1 [Varroa jacobsoni]